MKISNYKNYEVRKVDSLDWWKTNALSASDAAMAFAYDHDRSRVGGELRLRDGFSATIEVRLEGQEKVTTFKLSGSMRPEYKLENKDA